MSDKQELSYPDLPPRGRARKVFDKRTTVLVSLLLIMFVVLVALELRGPGRAADPGTGGTAPAETGTARSAGPWTPAMQRNYAQKLAAKGLKKEAATAFEQYLASADADLEERANVLYTVGKLHYELGAYESALAAFYQAEVAGPAKDIQEELNRKIVACLENLGKSFDAQSELEQRTALAKPEEDDEARSMVVARIGKEEVTMGQLHDEIRKLQQQNPQYAKALQTDRKKLVEFLRQYIFEKLLSRKARKLGLDQQPEFRKQIEDIMDKALAQLLVSREIQSKVKIDPSDVKNYYEANRAKYVQRAQASVSHILLKDEETAQKVLNQAREGAKSFADLAKSYSEDQSTRSEGGLLKEPVVEGTELVASIGSAPEFVAVVFATAPGKVAEGTVKSPAGYHVIKVNRSTPARALPFEEARQRVFYDYYLEKSQAAMSQMIQETLEVERVQIYDHVFMGPGGAPVEEPKE